MWTQLPPEKGHTHIQTILAHVYCGQTAGRMKTPLVTEIDVGPGHIVLNGDPALRERGTAASPLFSTHVYCGQKTAWIKMPLGTEVGLGSGDIVVDPAQSPPERGTAAPLFSAHLYCGQTVAHLSYC